MNKLLPPLALLLLGLGPVPLHADEATAEAMRGALLSAIAGSDRGADGPGLADPWRRGHRGPAASPEARLMEIDLQRSLAERLWTAGSERASARGAQRVARKDLREPIEAAVRFDERRSGDVAVTTAGGETVVAASALRRQQAVGDSARALLTVEQDRAIRGDAALLPLDDDAVRMLRQALDVVALAAADVARRREGAAGALEEAIREVAPTAPAATGPVAAADPTAAPPGPLRAIVAQQIAAGAPAGDAERARSAALFLANVQQFHARYEVPPGGLTLPESLGAEVEAFLSDLLERARAAAQARGESVIRAPDVHLAVQAAAPHRVNDLEEVVFFPYLAADERVTISAYDLESLREFGLHWRLFDVALDAAAPGLPPDPFATQLLGESVARYALLLLRLGGAAIWRRDDAPFLMGEHIHLAARDIRSYAKLDAKVRSGTSSTVDLGLEEPARASTLTDATAAAGIGFRHRSSAWLERLRRRVDRIPPTFSGGGVAAGDVDGDGDQDLLFVGGIGSHLYLNDSRGGFSLSAQSDALGRVRSDGTHGEARQPIFADFDNDGDQDVLVTFARGPHRLLRNEGEEGLRDVSERAGLGGGEGIAGPAAVFDFDRDGLLDVYVCRFGDYAGSGPAAGDMPSGAGGAPNGGRNALYRNRGGLRFEAVQRSGADDPGWCQAVTHTDLDGDGLQDLVVANDFGRNALLRNTGDGRFEDVTGRLGLTAQHHSRSVGLSDLNGDRFPDLYVSNINELVKGNPLARGEGSGGALVGEASTLYMSSANAGALQRFAPSTVVARTNEPGWAWDAEFFDFDNDGDDDLYVANGSNAYYNRFALREVDGEYFNWNHEANVLLVNEDGLLRARKAEGEPEAGQNSRSAVYLDADGDGDLDVALNNFEGPATLYRNDLAADGANWVALRLEGDPERGSSRDAIGARVVATPAGGAPVWREVRGGSGFLSMEPKVQHVGLGAATEVDVEIRWPGGQVQRYDGLDANRVWDIRETGGIAGRGDAP